jgi:hypothetical protein
MVIRKITIPLKKNIAPSPKNATFAAQSYSTQL